MLEHATDDVTTLIVGGGIAGCNLAFALSKQRTGVVLLEQGRIGRQGASTLPIALLNPHRGRSAQARPLDRAGLQAFWQVNAELVGEGLETGAHRSGVLRIAPNARRARAWRSLVAEEQETGASWLEPEQVTEPYHAPHGALLIRRGGWVEPETLLRALTTAAERRGARILEEHRLLNLERRAAGFRVTTSRGELEAERVILCTGADPNPQLPLPPLPRAAGEVVALKTPLSLALPVAGAVYGTQRRGGTFYIGGNHRNPEQEDPEAPTKLQASMSWFLPELKNAERTSVWTGVRAGQAGQTPLTTELQPGLWFFGALAGRGFLCSALLSRQLSQRLC